MKKFIALFGLLVFGLVLFGCLGQPSEKLDVVTNESANGGVPSSTGETAVVSGDCGTDMDCFITAALTCSKSKVDWTYSLPIGMGINLMGRNSMEINGTKDGKCIFYIKLTESKATISDEVRQQALASGMTESAIDAQISQINDAYADEIGSYETCKFNADDLAAMLTRWKEGAFSSQDYDVAECWGTMFGNPVEGCTLSTTSIVAMSKNKNITVRASDFKGSAESLQWNAEDPSVVSISATTGSSITITGLQTGSTHIIVTDNAVGPDCKFSIDVQVI